MTATKSSSIYSLIPLAEFKSVMGIDDREDKLAKFCLVTSTLTIEQYCKRRFLVKTYHERIEFNNDAYLVMKEYPVRNVLAVYAHYHFDQPDIIEPEFYVVVPDVTSKDEIQYTIILSPAVLRLRSLAGFKVIYRAGYDRNNVPADLAAACLELASWNFHRYKGRRVGMTGNLKGSGKDGEHFEMSIPENVKRLLEPYRRKTI
jgi:hypothetical protein